MTLERRTLYLDPDDMDELGSVSRQWAYEMDRDVSVSELVRIAIRRFLRGERSSATNPVP